LLGIVRELQSGAIVAVTPDGPQGPAEKVKPGAIADVSVLADERGRFILRDNEKTQVVAERLLQPQFCLRAGKRYDADAVILPEAVAA
jgi:dihydroorotase